MGKGTLYMANRKGGLTMKQVECRIAHYHLSGDVTYFSSLSYPMYDYQVEEYIANEQPTNPYYKIVDVKVIDIEEA